MKHWCAKNLQPLVLSRPKIAISSTDWLVMDSKSGRSSGEDFVQRRRAASQKRVRVASFGVVRAELWPCLVELQMLLA